MIARALIVSAAALYAVLDATPAAAQTRPGTRGAREVVLSAPRVEIPLVKEGPFYYVDVRINGRPFRFTLETGAAFAAVSNRVAEQLGFPRDTTTAGRGVVSMRPDMPVVASRVDSISVGGVTFRDMEVRVTSTFDGFPFDGILSIPYLRDLLWTLDLGRSRLVLERGALGAANGSDILEIPGRDMAGRVDMPLLVGDRVLPAVLDTRYADWIMMNDSMTTTLPLASPLRVAGTAMGPSVGVFEMRGARLDGALRVGRYSLPNAPIVFRTRGGTIVGNAFLEQFALTVDQSNGRIRVARETPVVTVAPLAWETADTTAARRRPLREESPAGDRTFGFRMAVRPDGRLFVVQLDPRSEAARLGVRDGDQVLEVDGTPFDRMTPQIFRAALAKGVAVKFVLLQGSVRRELSIPSVPR